MILFYQLTSAFCSYSIILIISCSIFIQSSIDFYQLVSVFLAYIVQKIIYQLNELYLINIIGKPNQYHIIMDIAAFFIVLFVWGLIAFQFFSYMIVFSPILLKHNYYLFWAIIPLFIIIVILLCWSYLRSICSNPGYTTQFINSKYQFNIQQLRQMAKRQAEEKKKRRREPILNQQQINKQIEQLNKVSYCQKCSTVKERRVHHCSICNRCVLRMDHHCPWVGNCVGKLNHKYFILFLFYATIALSVVGLSVVIDYFQGLNFIGQLTDNYKTLMTIVGVSTILLTLSIGFLLVTQIMGGYRNITTLQSFTPGIQDQNPWDTGSVFNNFEEIMGKTWWFIPTTPQFIQDNMLMDQVI